MLFVSCVCVCRCRGCCSLSVCACDLLILLHEPMAPLQETEGNDEVAEEEAAARAARAARLKASNADRCICTTN